MVSMKLFGKWHQWHHRLSFLICWTRLILLLKSWFCFWDKRWCQIKMRKKHLPIAYVLYKLKNYKIFNRSGKMLIQRWWNILYKKVQLKRESTKCAIHWHYMSIIFIRLYCCWIYKRLITTIKTWSHRRM